MSLLTLTITAPTSSFGEHNMSERTEINYLLHQAASQIGMGTATSGSLIARSGGSVGSWTYTPVATIP